MHPHEPQHPCVSTRTPPRTQDRKSKHLKTWLVTQNRASPPSRPSASGAAARGSQTSAEQAKPGKRASLAGPSSAALGRGRGICSRAWQSALSRRARTISGHRESLQLCSEFRGVMHPVIQKRQAASGSLRRAGEAGQASEPPKASLCSEFRGVMHPVIQKRQAASGSLPKASKVRKKVPGLARAGAPPGEPATVADASIKDTSVRDIRLIHLRGRPAVRKPARASQGRTPGHGRRRAREHPSSSHAHGNGAQARAKSTARMGGAPEAGRPPRAAIQRGPCPKILPKFDRRPLAGARGRLWAPLARLYTHCEFPAGFASKRTLCALGSCSPIFTNTTGLMMADGSRKSGFAHQLSPSWHAVSLLFVELFQYPCYQIQEYYEVRSTLVDQTCATSHCLQ